MTRTKLSFAPSPLLGTAALLLGLLPVLSGCGTGVEGPDDENVANDDDALSTVVGCDYSFSRPSISGLHSQGYKFAARYLSYDSGKNLSHAEAKSLIAGGLAIVSNWESTSKSSLGGYNQGVSDAKEAEKQALADGMPSDRPIYFSVDFDATPGQQGTIDSYMDGVASVIGRGRTGAYGGYYVIKRLFDAGKIKWGWQTYAWSGGKWDARAQLRQVQNGLDNDEIDKDIAVATDFGQWGHATSGGSSGGGSGGGSSADCKVHSDGKLYCDNKDNSAMYKSENTSSAVVNHLRSTSSWFKCWDTGALHAGGNHTWYYTLGDDNGTWGWVPAVDLDTNSAFDANPTAHGLKHCSEALPKLPSNCNVHSDDKLYCDNKANSAMYKTETTSAAVVNHLESKSSWFKCWGTGALHAGGNHTWYYTLGDANGNWGWVPAVDLQTTSTFDSNPSAYGMKKCD